MKYRKLNLSDDFPALKELWKKTKMSTPPVVDMMSENGIIAYEDDKIIGGVFMWLTTGSLIAFIGFPILDIDYKGEDRAEVLKTLFDKAETVASYHGYKYSFHYSGLDHMTRVLKGHGYVVGDTNVTNLIKAL